jgi:hypothetical protein
LADETNKKGVRMIRKTFLFLGLAILLATLVCPAASISKTIKLDNGDVYRDACGPIQVGTRIYRFRPGTKDMVYVGEVVNLGRAFNERIVWLWVPATNRIEPKTRKAVCDWGWVRFGDAEK